MSSTEPLGTILAKRAGLQLPPQDHNSSSPLPPPSLLSGYEAVCPGAADRIIRMAEQEVEHRRATETAIVRAGVAQGQRDSDDAKRGQIFALVIVLTSIGGAIFLGFNGHELSASALGLGAVGSVVTTFIMGRAAKSAESHAPKLVSETLTPAASELEV